MIFDKKFFDSYSFALKKLPKDVLCHSYRVYYKAVWLTGEKYNAFTFLALMHDVFEDTDLPLKTIEDLHLRNSLDLLTRKKEQKYDDYISSIRENKQEYFETYAVKILDLQDHLQQRKTLKKSLENRYIKALLLLYM